jgi:hypothetical protein
MYISLFYFLYSFRRFFVYFPLHVHVYILASGPQMNTSAIHNRMMLCQNFNNLITAQSLQVLK